MNTISESVTPSCTDAYIHTQVTDPEYQQDFFATPLSPYGLPVCLLGTSVSQTPRLPYCIHLYTGASLSQTHVCRHCFKGLTLLQGLLRFFCKVEIMLVSLIALRVHFHSQSAQALGAGTLPLHWLPPMHPATVTSPNGNAYGPMVNHLSCKW